MFFSSKKAGPVEWLVVGLGNPGDKYAWTRHNMGYLVIDELAERLSIPVKKLKYKALTNTAVLGGHSVLLMKPTTYMNLSGESVGQAARFYKIPPERVLVISDDVALPQGKLRVRRSGSAGGHNGLKNIVQHLGNGDFTRIRVGVGGKPNPDFELMDFVLGHFSGEDRKVMEETVSKAADAVACMVTDGVDLAMNRFNTPRKKKKKPEKEQTGEQTGAADDAGKSAEKEPAGPEETAGPQAQDAQTQELQGKK